MKAAEDAEPTRVSGDAEQEKPPSGAPAVSNDSAKKSKRLLPMELRRRRRAAKLQVTIDKQMTQGKGGIETPEKRDEAMPPTPRANAEDQRAEGQQPVASKPPVVSAMARLSSMYSAQLSRKRVKLGHGTAVSVPSALQVNAVPIDLVPKSRVIVQTSFPLPFLRLDSRAKKLAMESFLSGQELPHTAINSPPGARWYRALHYFTHPAAPLPASITLNRITAGTKTEAVAASAKGRLMKEEQAFYVERLHTWQQALRDLYLGFRKRHDCSTFYLRSSEFVVCFYQSCGRPTSASASIAELLRAHVQRAEAIDNEDGSASTGGGDGRAVSTTQTSDHSVCAVMSQSNSRIRKALLRLNVAYSLPYSNANNTKREAGEFHLLEEELIALKGGQQSTARTSGLSSAAPAVHGPDSLLLFQGHDAVHGLFEFLINRKPLSNQDVPELFARHPFEHGTIQTLRATSFGRIGSTLAAPSAVSEATEGADSSSDHTGGMFRVEIRGFCFPESIAELLDTLRSEAVRVQERHVPQDRSGPPVPARHDGLPSKEAARDSEVALRAYMELTRGCERLNAATLAAGNAPGALPPLPLQTMTDRERHSQTLEFTKRRLESVTVRQVNDTLAMTVETTARTAQRVGT